MDARAVAEATGVEVGTLNVWVQRGLIPGMTVGARGRLRDFDVGMATHIAIITELLRLGIAAPLASMIAVQACHGKRFVLAQAPRALMPPTQPKVAVQSLHVSRAFENDADLPAILASLFPDEPPAVYVVINVERIGAKMREAEQEWQRLRGDRKDS